MNSPRLLVSTVPAWNSLTGSDTMASLLEGYDKEKLACLYVKADRSDSTVCHKYFHIIESRVIKSIFKRNVRSGEEYDLGSVAEPSVPAREAVEERSRLNHYRDFRPASFLLGRELLWKIGKWKSAELDAFLDEFRPEVFFFPIESYIYFNRINEYVVSRCKPRKVIGYLWDDNFTYKQVRHGLLSRLQRFWLRQGVKRLVGQCDTVFSICPKMKRECDAEFGIDSVLLTKPVAGGAPFRSYHPSRPIQIVYTGKLNIGRDDTIAQVVSALERVNANGVKAQLHIYSQTSLSESKKRTIDVPPSCLVHGPVSQAEVAGIQENADILLFVESLSDRNPVARLSFSTKLTDYFSAGKCIWAVGNDDLAPMEYLKERDAGLVSTDFESILDCLEMLAGSPDLILEYARKSFDCGMKNHNVQDVKRKLWEAFE